MFGKDYKLETVVVKDRALAENFIAKVVEASGDYYK
jgi:hypothetical protein